MNRTDTQRGFTRSLKIGVVAGKNFFSPSMQKDTASVYRTHATRRMRGARPISSAGFTVMLAALTASLLLLLSTAMFNIVRKEIILSSTSRDSQFAFYAADAGAECALYWDFRFNAFEEGSGTVTCESSAVPVSINQGGHEFEFEPEGYCVRVRVEKNEEHPRTVIRSRGYNSSCTAIATNPRALERAVELQY